MRTRQEMSAEDQADMVDAALAYLAAQTTDDIIASLNVMHEIAEGRPLRWLTLDETLDMLR